MATPAPAIPVVQPNRSFNALSGLELKKAILAQIQRQLDSDTRFGQHIAYARVAWRWKMALDFYPNDMDKKFETETGADLRPPEPRREIEIGEKPEQHDIAAERTVAAPLAGDTADQVRRDSGLPLPSPRTVAGIEGQRISVDAPIVPIPGHGEDSEVIESARVETNVPRGGHTVARSATIRNRANPKGIDPSKVEPQGHPPTEADMEKIIEKEIAAGTLEPSK